MDYILQRVLKIKLSERNRKCKEKFANVFRSMQNHRIANESVKSGFTSLTKHVLTELKEIDEQNKSLRTIHCEILVKFGKLKFVNPEKTDNNWYVIVNVLHIIFIIFL